MVALESPPTASAQTKRKWVRTALVVLGLLLLLAATLWIRGMLMRADVANRDFVAYWTTGRLLAQHHNPYDTSAVFQMEKSRGAQAGHALVMRNPPWALFLTVPLGWFDAPTAGLLWLIAVIAAGLGSLQLIVSRPQPIPLILIFFAPVLICIETEQTSLFVLLGLMLFARLEAKRPFLAGLALILVMLKPHLLFVFLIILALEVMRKRQIALAAGFLAGFAAANGIALAVRHQIWSEYFASMGQERMQDYFYPNVANLYRLFTGGTALWPLAIPAVVAIAWALRYWGMHRAEWDWEAKLPLIAAVSVFVAPYSYPNDQVLFWPAVLAAWTRASRPAKFLLVALNLGAIAITLRATNLGSPLYLWTGPAWMLWCLWVWRAKAAAQGERRPRTQLTASL